MVDWSRLPVLFIKINKMISARLIYEGTELSHTYMKLSALHFHWTVTPEVTGVFLKMDWMIIII